MIEPQKKGLIARLKETYYKAIKYAQTPIQFYAAIIIVFAGLIGYLAWKSVLPPNLTMWIIILSFVVILGILVWVSYLLITNPSKLVLGKEEYITMMREKLGDNIKGEKYYLLEILQTETPQALQKPNEENHGEGEQ